MRRAGEAPIWPDALRVATWVAANVRGEDVASRRLRERVVDLVEHVSEALHGFDTAVAVDDADRDLVRLRALARLAFEAGSLPEGGLLHLAKELDGIGRQVGGWRKRLNGG